ncbi:MAG: hypothetical protein PHH85_03465 [Candidatus Methanoperedens sp.]|nr:hypothetical protein [Candidatus Methanoperedens sp.]
MDAPDCFTKEKTCHIKTLSKTKEYTEKTAPICEGCILRGR